LRRLSISTIRSRTAAGRISDLDRRLRGKDGTRGERLEEAEEDIAKSIDWGEKQTPRDERSLAVWYASRARILEQRALFSRRSGDATAADVRFKKAKADIDRALTWYETLMPSDVRSIAILRADKARINEAAASNR
jgi:hypothetical protein